MKLNALFGPQQAAQLRQIGRVAANVQAEPAGAAVNHSNTAAAGASMALNALTSLADKMKLPGLNIARNSINQFVNERASQTALGGELPMAVQRRSLDSLNQLLPFVPGVAGARLCQRAASVRTNIQEAETMTPIQNFSMMPAFR